MATTVVTLGDFQFRDMEVPESILFGGGQALVVHKLVGGQRVVDAMGPDDAPKDWRGWFRGQDAVSRARYIDTLRKQGRALTLTWDAFRFNVVIATFEADFRRAYEIPYRISLEVVEDLTAPITQVAGGSIDDAMGDDMSSAIGLGGSIGDGALSSALGTLNSAVTGVSSFANASTSVINSVLGPIGTVLTRTNQLIAGAGNSIQNIGTLGGVLPNTPIGLSSQSLAAQVVAFNQLPNLYALQNVVGRMRSNLGSVAGAGRSVPVSGGNLMDMAASQYGDATAWTGIAKANGLSDPMLTGLQTISVPLRADNAGGLLGD
ncbi:MAG: hypothetical protein GAK28_00117 [Luteibacter sp.]|uniref:hypothetical protein n=1 Tax=Luteibacter sp. TaxID=1886636 RepID=UPI0013824389|nr:hypothetical protein [Luteibacter sp.]KAF1009479.1 MAG: hypothetical protein GAK28_00117 [Luteibacter sp.]